MLHRGTGEERWHPTCTISKQALQTYFDGLYEGDTAKLGRVFHDVAHLFYVTDGNLGDMSREQWFDMVRSRKSAQSQDLQAA